MTPEPLMALVREWRDEDCTHAWAKKHQHRDELAELICAEELIAALKAWAEHYTGDDNEWVPPKQIRERVLGVEER